MNLKIQYEFSFAGIILDYTIHPHPNPPPHRRREIRLSASESLPPPRGKVRMGVVGCPSRLDPI
ncbi:MAG: hypothetical protein M1330_03775, partial [Armatimonadetes bacterium]|nr:hypothetical protein [Armatimonadota bacterium]